MYVEFLKEETAKEIRELTESFDAYTLLHPMSYDDYCAVHRSYLREVLALIRKNIKAYVNGDAVETFHATVIIDSETVSKMQDRAEYFIRVKLFKPVEYLGEIAAALAHELDEKQEATK
nr:MAG TPA: hypothetical protein [Caudoviricetes sp.]